MQDDSPMMSPSGGPSSVCFDLDEGEVYRREGGEWKAVPLIEVAATIGNYLHSLEVTTPLAYYMARGVSEQIALSVVGRESRPIPSPHQQSHSRSGGDSFGQILAGVSGKAVEKKVEVLLSPEQASYLRRRVEAKQRTEDDLHLLLGYILASYGIAGAEVETATLDGDRPHLICRMVTDA